MLDEAVVLFAVRFDGATIVTHVRHFVQLVVVAPRTIRPYVNHFCAHLRSSVVGIDTPATDRDEERGARGVGSYGVPFGFVAGRIRAAERRLL